MIKKVFTVMIILIFFSMVMYLFLRLNNLEEELNNDNSNIDNIVNDNVISQFPTSKVIKMTIKDLVKTTGVAYTLESREIIFQNMTVEDFIIMENSLVTKNQILDHSGNLVSNFFGVVLSIVQVDNDVKITYDNYEKMGVSVYVPQNDSFKLLNDNMVEIQFLQEKMAGKIIKIANEYTEGDPKLKIDLEFDNDFSFIRPNAILNVNFVYKEYQNITCVSTEFLYNSDGTFGVVYVIRDEKIVPVIVQIGMEYNHKIEIIAGDIQVGDILVKL